MHYLYILSYEFGKIKIYFENVSKGMSLTFSAQIFLERSQWGAKKGHKVQLTQELDRFLVTCSGKLSRKNLDDNTWWLSLPRAYNFDNYYQSFVQAELLYT